MMHDIIGADMKSADLGVFWTDRYRSDMKWPPISTGRYSHVCIWHLESNRELCNMPHVLLLLFQMIDQPAARWKWLG